MKGRQKAMTEVEKGGTNAISPPTPREHSRGDAVAV